VSQANHRFKKFETWNVIYIWTKQLKNILFFYFLELPFRLYKSVDYWHRYAEPSEIWFCRPCANWHHYAEPSELRITVMLIIMCQSSELQMRGQLCRSVSPYGTRCNTKVDHAIFSCAVRHSYVESSELQIGLDLSYMVNCADSALFARNRIRPPIGTVTLRHSKSIKND